MSEATRICKAFGVKRLIICPKYIYNKSVYYNFFGFQSGFNHVFIGCPGIQRGKSAEKIET